MHSPFRVSGDDDPDNGASSSPPSAGRQMPTPARPNQELADPEETCPYVHIRDHPSTANQHDAHV